MSITGTALQNRKYLLSEQSHVTKYLYFFSYQELDGFRGVRQK